MTSLARETLLAEAALTAADEFRDAALPALTDPGSGAEAEDVREANTGAVDLAVSGFAGFAESEIVVVQELGGSRSSR